MDNIDITLSIGDLKEIVKETMSKAVLNTMEKNKVQIEKSLDEYFKKHIFSDKSSTFESSLDWAIDVAFREGLNKAMEELNYKEMVFQKAKELLQDNNFLKDLAEKKVRASLGLPTE